MKTAKTIRKAVGIIMAKMHHHQTIIFFCRRRRARKKNKKENLTLTIAAPSSDVIESVSFSPYMRNGMKSGGGLLRRAATSCVV